MIGSLRAAASMLTVLPLDARPDERTAGLTVAAFPLVGALLGLGLAVADAVVGAIAPPAVAAVVVLTAWVLMTGGLHVDGWIDLCDAMAPGLDEERSLAAMKDPRVGAFGIVGCLLLLALKASALGSLAPGRGAVLIAAAVAARWAVALPIVAFPYVRGREGIAWTLAAGTRVRHLLLSGLIAVSALGASFLARRSWGGHVLGGAVETGPLAGAVDVVGPLLLAAAATLLVATLAGRRLGGVTGDVYGAGIELSETVVLVAAAVQGS